MNIHRSLRTRHIAGVATGLTLMLSVPAQAATAASALTPASSAPLSAAPGTDLPDGLRIIDVVKGSGAEAKAGATVVVNYTGYLYQDGARGEKFDASADHGGTFSFTLGNHDVIKGWDEGVAGMKVGGKRTLIVPPDLGYDGKAAGTIPPFSTLIFDIELVDVK